MPGRADEQHYVAIHTEEGRYDAGLAVDNPNNFPRRGKMSIGRYIISEPPSMMRNVPKYYIAEKLLRRQARKCDIRNPGPYQTLWNRKQYTQESANSRLYRRESRTAEKKNAEATERNATERTTETESNRKTKRQKHKGKPTDTQKNTQETHQNTKRGNMAKPIVDFTQKMPTVVKLEEGCTHSHTDPLIRN